jgi:hypothetical protein
MITKAIVKAIPSTDNNKYTVYIPLLRNANDSEADATFNATLCFLNGVFYSLAIDDVVYVAFEDNYYEKPVIIGKLYTGSEDKNNVPTQITAKTIKVLDKAQFPSDTTISDKTLNDISLRLNELEESVKALQEKLNK